MSNYIAIPDLLNNAAATGAAAKWPGGTGTLYCRGTFGGATVTLETNLNRGSGAAVWGPVAGVSLTADGAIGFALPPGDIRVAVAGGAPSALFAHAVRINP